MTHPGAYCLRSNVPDWDADNMWKTYITPTDAENGCWLKVDH